MLKLTNDQTSNKLHARCLPIPNPAKTAGVDGGHAPTRENTWVRPAKCSFAFVLTRLGKGTLFAFTRLGGGGAWGGT